MLRNLLVTLALLLVSATLTSGSLFLPFLNAVEGGLDVLSPNNASQTASEDITQEVSLEKRQSSVNCPQDYSNCQKLGAPGLCCANNAVCSADSAGYVACCPKGAACTGTITGVITNGVGTITTATATMTTQGQSTASNGEVLASTTSSNGGFIISGTSTVAVPASAPRRVEIVSEHALRVNEREH